VSNAPSRTCIQDSVLCPAGMFPAPLPSPPRAWPALAVAAALVRLPLPTHADVVASAAPPRADHAMRFLLDQAVQPRCPLAQLVVVAAERPPDVYLSWIARGRRDDNIKDGRLGIVDCFSDPCGWKAAWRARQPDQDAAVSQGGGRLESSANFGKVRMTSATRNGADGFQELVSAVQGLLAQAGDSEGPAAGHAGNESEGCVGSRFPIFVYVTRRVDFVGLCRLAAGSEGGWC